MKQGNQLDSLNPPLSPSPERLTDPQRQVLAKVYRFLLGLKRATTNGDEDEQQIVLSGSPYTDDSTHAAAELPEE